VVLGLGVAGALGLFGMYRWPTRDVFVFYFIVRPAFVWFLALLPLVLIGLLGMRYEWFLAGFALWTAALWSTEEVGQAWNLRSPAGPSARTVVARADVMRVPMRVVTWNMLGARRGVDEVLTELERARPDLAFLQEFALRWKIREPLQSNEFFRDYHLSEVEGNAILSRWPVEKVPLPPLQGRRGGAWAVRLASDVQVFCVNVHLRPIRLRTQLVRNFTLDGLQQGVDDKARDLADLRAALAGFGNRAVIAAGDLNAPPHYPGLAHATWGLVDCFSVAGRGWGRTAPAKLPVVRVDMVFVPRGADVLFARAVPSRYSDHYMTLTEVNLPVPRTRKALVQEAFSCGARGSWTVTTGDGT
jgi:endonuclease/exonuclease/phosphatase (EEP) superfamily protein YafD